MLTVTINHASILHSRKAGNPVQQKTCRARNFKHIEDQFLLTLLNKKVIFPF